MAATNALPPQGSPNPGTSAASVIAVRTTLLRLFDLDPLVTTYTTGFDLGQRVAGVTSTLRAIEGLSTLNIHSKESPDGDLRVLRTNLIE